jgi:PAS domain S-box-containing protein
MDDKDREIEKLTKRISGLEKTLQIVSGHSGRIEQNLRQLFEAISDIMPVPMLITSKTGKIFFANGKSGDIFGFSEQEFYKINAIDIYQNPEDRYMLLKAIDDDGQVRGFSVNLKKSDGSIFPAFLFSQSIIFENQNCLLTVVHDLSALRLEEEKRQMVEKQLRYMQKMEAIGTLAGGIAHDFNNILFSIIGYTEMTADEMPKESRAHKNLEEVLKAALRAKELVNQILTFSRQHEHEKTILKIQPVIKETLKMLRSTLPSTIRIVQNIDRGCSPVLGDPTQIYQIIMNLCTNAFHAMQDTGGVMEIKLEETEIDITAFPDALPGTYLKLSIRDSGIGMSEDIQERIVDPFFTTKPVGKGTGLGLSVVHGIVKQMSGYIRVFSAHGKGSVFIVYLPVITSENIHIRASAASDETPLTGSERIMLVDDEKAILGMLRQMIGELGYRIISFTSSMEAFQVFQNSPDEFDLVITDMTMPDMTGSQLARKLLEIRPDIPIILCTGFSEQINEKMSEAMGIQGYLMKPVVRTEMAKIIRKALNHRK